jgi:glycosyltransferase involved in cell wall biosynthesis
MIALLHGAPAFGAVERYVVAIAEGLRDEDLDAAIVYPNVPELAPFAAAGLHAVPLDPALVAGPAPRLVFELRRTIRELKPTAVHVTDIWPAASIAARLAGVRRLLLTHHTPELPRSDNLAGRLLRTASWAVRPTVIYTSAADQRTDGRRLLPTVVVPLGIDIQRFASARRAIAPNGPVVGNVARLALQKGQRHLIDAAPRVLKRRPDTQFVLVGDGDLRGELEQLAESLGVADAFTFTGHRDDIPELLASFDVFAFPSLFEGLCLAVIEAQAAGIPVVATPVGGIVETVIDGVTGLLCTPGDPVSLANSILRLLEDRELARGIASEAKTRAHEGFDQRRMVERTLALYGVHR